MKKIISTFALLLPALASMAVVPVEQPAGQDLHPEFSNDIMKVVKKASSSENQNSFFEGFEGRDPYGYGFAANAWLPSGWTQFSRQGNKHVSSGAGYWDLTWLTLNNDCVGSLPSNDQTSSYEGDAFAYIMADVMWGEKKPYPDLGLDYATNHPQDEWLVTPEFTPNPEEWFYFKLQFRPGWSLYNREANDFSSETTLLEVYVTEGDGTTDSDWKKLWNLKDYINQHYTQAQLRADLVTGEKPAYESIFVKVSDYVGKKVKVAFRFFGVNGQGMAIDNVSLGIPMPKPSYTLPSGFFKQQSLTPTMQEITGTPQLLIPFGIEATWANTSQDILTNEWSYDGADGSKLTSTAWDLVTPAYEVEHKYEAPVLTGLFESRSEKFQTKYASMQAGGRLTGTGNGGYNGNFGVATYDYLDPEGTLAQSSNQISFHNGLNNAWETILGRMPNTLDILGIGCVYAATPTEYGFDYVDVFAQITGDANGNLNDNTAIVLNVFRLPEDEYTESATVIGQAVLTGKDINTFTDLEPGYNYKNLRFTLDVPVVTDGNILVLLTPYNIEGDDKIVFPYMKSTDEKVWGNSVVYMMVYESEDNGGTYDTFYNLNAYPMSKGHFAGLTMSLGATYSYMESPDYKGSLIEIPYGGGEYKLDIKAMYAPENWVVSTDGVTKSDWISLSAVKDGAQSNLYHTTVTFAENPQADPRETEVFITQAGSRVALNVKQAGNPTSVENIAVENAMSVSVNGSTITVTGINGLVDIYSATGAKVASANAEGSVYFDAASFAHGVYVVRGGKSAVKIVL